MLARPPSSGRFRLEREHVDMNLVRRMFSENLDGALFPGGIVGAYPQQQAAPHNLPVEILRMMLSEPFGEHRNDQSAGPSCERGPGDNREQGSAGRHDGPPRGERRSEEHTSELQSLMRIPYAVFCLKKKNTRTKYTQKKHHVNIN